ncbi:MAG: 5'/3'-nucleotidase SurE [Sulfurovum sp.]|nr:5'/3'-nucleotidase SurE [Sulfurovaceae bacterium]
MKKILITNDDGYDSAGIIALTKALVPLGDITVVAPSLEKSACGHSLTLTKPLRFIEVNKNSYKLDDGTPTDCVFLSLNKFFTNENRPDIVISGINKGANMGEDITYSGTASASMEAVLQGIPSIAISQVCADNCENIDSLKYKLASVTIYNIVKKIFSNQFPLPPRKFLNINIPPIEPDKSKGIKITKVGKRLYKSSAEVHYNPRGLEYYWIGLPALDWYPVENLSDIMTDFEAVSQNFVSITPIHLDMTSYDDIENLKNWI